MSGYKVYKWSDFDELRPGQSDENVHVAWPEGYQPTDAEIAEVLRREFVGRSADEVSFRKLPPVRMISRTTMGMAIMELEEWKKSK